MTIHPAIIDDASLQIDAKNLQVLDDLIREYPDEAQLIVAAIEEAFTRGPIQVIHPEFDDSAMLAKAKRVQDLATLIMDYPAQAKLIISAIEEGSRHGQTLLTMNSAPVTITMDEHGNLRPSVRN